MFPAPAFVTNTAIPRVTPSVIVTSSSYSLSRAFPAGLSLSITGGVI
jgi:hypothetical protein